MSYCPLVHLQDQNNPGTLDTRKFIKIMKLKNTNNRRICSNLPIPFFINRLIFKRFVLTEERVAWFSVQTNGGNEKRVKVTD